MIVIFCFQNGVLWKSCIHFTASHGIHVFQRFWLKRENLCFYLLYYFVFFSRWFHEMFAQTTLNSDNFVDEFCIGSVFSIKNTAWISDSFHQFLPKNSFSYGGLLANTILASEIITYKVILVLVVHIAPCIRQLDEYLWTRKNSGLIFNFAEILEFWKSPKKNFQPEFVENSAFSKLHLFI